METAFSENSNGSIREPSIVLAVPAHSSRFPLARLIQLIVLLQTERCPNARRLAEICEVSRRTIYRDLAALAGAGITVLYRSDRQGYQLAQNVFLQPPKMEEREALALLVSCRQWGSGDDMGLSRHANQAIDKLIQGFPEGMRTRLIAAAEILCDASDRPESSAIRQEVDDRILVALTQRLQVRLRVRESGARGAETTKLGIYRLAKVHGFWSLVGRSTRHCRVLLIPTHQIEQVELTEDPYSIPPRFNLSRFLAKTAASSNLLLCARQPVTDSVRAPDSLGG
jgi:predicted DNA-binding transcriptional regulator YafY